MHTKLPITTITIILLQILIFFNTSYAGEGGGSSYTPGSADLNAGVLPPPGAYYKSQMFYRTAGIRTDDIDAQIERNVNVHTVREVLTLVQVTKSRVLGSYWAWECIVRGAYTGVTADITQAGVPRREEDSVVGVNDLILAPFVVGYHRGRSHYRARTSVYFPTGQYTIKHLANTAQNRWAVEQNFGYTWLDPQSGYEASCFLGYTVPFRNAATDYLSGQELHFDYALAKHLPSKFTYGLAGYWFQQTTADSGTGARLGAFKGSTLGLGGLISWVTSGDNPTTFTIKYYEDIDSKNRLAGSIIWFNFNGRF